MTRSTTTPATRLLLLAAALTLALGMSLASPAAAFVDDDETSPAQVEEQDEADRDDGHADDHADGTANNGFVNDADDREAAPTGGVDAGFGGAAGADRGLGTIQLMAVTLLALAILAHTAAARRSAHVRA